MRLGPITIGWGSRRHQGQRSYAAATANRLTADWVFGPLSANEELKQGLPVLRERARQLERDNPYARRYLALCEQNIVGRGMGFSSKVYDPGPDGKPDTRANDEIETAWRDWGLHYAGVVPGQTWLDIQRLVVRAWKRDGEVFVRLMRGSDNPYRFSLQILESDFCDHTYNVESTTGNTITMGVELTQAGAPVAYYMRKNHPGDTGAIPTDRVRIPASEIVHVYRPDRPGQARGVPAMTSIMLALNMLSGYEEAELVAARTAASKCAFYVIPPGEDYQGETKDDSGPIEDTSPGQIGKLPYAWDIKTVDWQHPGSNYSAYVKAALRKIANGLGVSYNNFANDLEGVNFSSLRGGTIEERDAWTSEQDAFIDHFCRPVFAAWLDMWLLSGLSTLPYSKKARFHADSWQGRRWQWVDPEKDLQAAEKAMALKIKSPSTVIAEQGADPDEVWSQIEKDGASMEAYGLVTTAAAPTGDGTAAAVQDTALNGAQIASMVEILKEAAAGTIPQGAVKPMLTAAFPTVGADQIAAIVGSLAGFKPAAPAPAPAPQKQEPPANGQK